MHGLASPMPRSAPTAALSRLACIASPETGNAEATEDPSTISEGRMVAAFRLWHRITALVMTFRSSRTFPGHSCSESRFIASGIGSAWMNLISLTDAVEKWPTSIGISERRFRSGGMTNEKQSIRCSKVRPKRPTLTSCSSVRCVAARKRRLIFRGLVEPTAMMVLLSSTRNNRACMGPDISPASSRKTVPPSALAKTRARRKRPSEGASLMAKEFALSQRLRQRRAVDAKKGLVGPPREAVEPFSQHLLANASLARIRTDALLAATTPQHGIDLVPIGSAVRLIRKRITSSVTLLRHRPHGTLGT